MRRYIATAFVVLSQLATPLTASAADYEKHAVSEIEARDTQLFSQAASGDLAARAAPLRELNHLYFEGKKRLALMGTVKDQGLSWNGDYIRYVESLLPRIEQVLAANGRTPSEDLYRADIAELNQRVATAERNLRGYFQDLSRRHPQLGRVVSLTSFARSETLSGGTIGEINPTDNRSIQDSATSGLMRVLDRVEKRERVDAGLLATLSDYHSHLLGKAAHYYSQPGRINDIVFRGVNGGRHVRDYLSDWAADFDRSQKSALTAHELSVRFLHLHPYGDSNGRITEVVKQMLLKDAGLPPLLTFEKTALENYAYQPMFGDGTTQKSVLTQLQDTEKFLRAWDSLLGARGEVHDVSISGNNIVVRARIDGTEKVIVSSRTYVLRASDPLPQMTKGSVVVVGRDAQDVTMRFTMDGWKKHADTKPSKTIDVQREGRVKMSLALYVVDATSKDLSFAFRYAHPNGSDVWFSNDGRNYNVGWNQMPSVSLKRSCSALFQPSRSLSSVCAAGGCATQAH